MKRWVLSLSLLWAQSPLLGQAADNCRPRSWPELADIILKRAPQLGTLESKVQLAKARQQEAREPLASNLSTEFTSGREPGSSASMAASYQWTVERGGKREARMDLARWEIERIALEAHDLEQQLLVEVGLLGERLQHIEHEQEVVKEAIGTYQAILRQFEGRPLLSPEQDANSAVFRLAKDEATLKLAHLDLERAQLLGRLRFLSGCDTLDVPENKMRLERTWPEVPDRSEQESSILVKNLEVSQALAQATYREAESRSIFDLTVGPLLSWDSSAKGQEWQAGVSLSVPLLGSRREAIQATAAAERSEKLAEANFTLRQRQSERDTWRDVYHQAKTHLNRGITEDEARRKHERLEGIFITGRVSAPLIIESHRQLQDHLTARHELALKALEALLNVKRLDGKLTKADL